ncbi:MAG TPA: hypothetical protein VM124_03060 [Candidatus Limnocylindrales bacterium]|nr:hypothetical protein [Candidatus Limnocylindrales bacterium]
MDNQPPVITNTPPLYPPPEPAETIALSKRPELQYLKVVGIFGVCLALLQIAGLLVLKFVVNDVFELDNLTLGLQVLVTFGLLFVSLRLLRSTKSSEVKTLLKVVMAYSLVSLVISLFAAQGGVWLPIILLLFVIRARKDLKKSGI